MRYFSEKQQPKRSYQTDVCPRGLCATRAMAGECGAYKLCEMFPHIWFSSYFILNKEMQGYTFTLKHEYVEK
jgi:hypothetical protein